MSQTAKAWVWILLLVSLSANAAVGIALAKQNAELKEMRQEVDANLVTLVETLTDGIGVLSNRVGAVERKTKTAQITRPLGCFPGDFVTWDQFGRLGC